MPDAAVSTKKLIYVRLEVELIFTEESHYPAHVKNAYVVSSPCVTDDLLLLMDNMISQFPLTSLDK